VRQNRIVMGNRGGIPQHRRPVITQSGNTTEEFTELSPLRTGDRVPGIVYPSILEMTGAGTSGTVLCLRCTRRWIPLARQVMSMDCAQNMVIHGFTTHVTCAPPKMAAPPTGAGGRSAFGRVRCAQRFVSLSLFPGAAAWSRHRHGRQVAPYRQCSAKERRKSSVHSADRTRPQKQHATSSFNVGWTWVVLGWRSTSCNMLAMVHRNDAGILAPSRASTSRSQFGIIRPDSTIRHVIPHEIKLVHVKPILIFPVAVPRHRRWVAGLICWEAVHPGGGRQSRQITFLLPANL